VSDCLRCGGMELEGFRLGPRAREDATSCALCAGYHDIEIEHRVHRLSEVSTEALVVELESRHFVFQRAVLSPVERVAERFYASTPPVSSPPEGSVLQTSHKQKRP